MYEKHVKKQESRTILQGSGGRQLKSVEDNRLNKYTSIAQMYMRAEIADVNGNSVEGVSDDLQGGSSLGIENDLKMAFPQIHAQFTSIVKPADVYDKETKRLKQKNRPQFQCAEPKALVSYLYMAAKNGWNITKANLDTLYFTNTKWDNTNPAEAIRSGIKYTPRPIANLSTDCDPCEVCSQWIQGNKTINTNIIPPDPQAINWAHMRLPDPNVPIVVAPTSTRESKKHKKRQKAKAAKANKQAPPPRG